MMEIPPPCSLPRQDKSLVRRNPNYGDSCKCAHVLARNYTLTYGGSAGGGSEGGRSAFSLLLEGNSGD